MKEQADVYEKITNSIIEAIEAGCGKFEMPWHTFGLLPSNARNHRRYRGINVLALWAAASRRGFKTNVWATYQQWHELGAQVRKGEKSARVVFWKFYGEEHETEDESSESKTGTRCFARAYHVFNADQVDGFTIPELPQLPNAERIERAEQFLGTPESGSSKRADALATIRKPMKSICRPSHCLKRQISSIRR